jgi:uncharacterized protein
MLPVAAGARNTHFIDNANLVTDEGEAKQLNYWLADISRSRNNDVVIITVPNLGNYNDFNGFSRSMRTQHGFSGDTVMLILDMNLHDRKFDIATFGFANDAFTDRGVNKLLDEIQPLLSAGNYYSAFELFAGRADNYLMNARAGNILYSSGYTPVIALICAGAGSVIALLITLGFKSSHKTAKPQRSACNYVVQNSFNLRNQKDLFLYSRVTKIAKPQNTGGGGRSGGGSRTGGGGRRF